MSVLFTFRCPDHIAARIQAEVEATGKDKTAVVLGLICQSLDIPKDKELSYDSGTQMSYSQDALDARMTQMLDKRITQILEERMTQMLDDCKTEMKLQLEALEERLGKLKAQ